SKIVFSRKIITQK
ncbi:hypothetical protein BVZ65_01026B, partial [Haemophilus influenzae]